MSFSEPGVVCKWASSIQGIATRTQLEDRGARRGGAGERTYELLRAEILSGRLRGGSVLAEDELAQRFAVSRTPVRHALSLLRQEGLAEGGPRRQLVVKKLSNADRREILLVRSALEQTAVREACVALPLDEVDNLRLLLLRQRRAASEGRVDDFLELDEAFHLAVAERAGLPRVARMLQQLGALRSVRRLSELNATEFAERMAPVIREHEAILDAIEARDAQAALAALERHLSDFVASMVDA